MWRIINRVSFVVLFLISHVYSGVLENRDAISNGEFVKRELVNNEKESQDKTTKNDMDIEVFELEPDDTVRPFKKTHEELQFVIRIYEFFAKIFGIGQSEKQQSKSSEENTSETSGQDNEIKKPENKKPCVKKQTESSESSSLESSEECNDNKIKTHKYSVAFFNKFRNALKQKLKTTDISSIKGNIIYDCLPSIEDSAEIDFTNESFGYDSDFKSLDCDSTDDFTDESCGYDSDFDGLISTDDDILEFLPTSQKKSNRTLNKTLEILELYLPIVLKDLFGLINEMLNNNQSEKSIEDFSFHNHETLNKLIAENQDIIDEYLPNESHFRSDDGLLESQPPKDQMSKKFEFIRYILDVVMKILDMRNRQTENLDQKQDHNKPKAYDNYRWNYTEFTDEAIIKALEEFSQVFSNPEHNSKLYKEINKISPQVSGTNIENSEVEKGIEEIFGSTLENSDDQSMVEVSIHIILDNIIDEIFAYLMVIFENLPSDIQDEIITYVIDIIIQKINKESEVHAHNFDTVSTITLSEEVNHITELKTADTPNKISNRSLIYISRYENKYTNWGQEKNSTFNVSFTSEMRMPIHSEPPPAYFDWRDANAVSPVKDQGPCLACWAFSACGSLESHLKIYLKQEFTLSEQFLIDCDPDSKGCTRGSDLMAVWGSIVSKLGGVLKSTTYPPYIARKNDCRWSKPPPYPVPVVGMKRVPQDEDAMVYYLYAYGPLSAAINSKSMEKYHGNYIDEPTEDECPKDYSKLDHDVLIVGYNVYVDQDTGHRTPYWIIKNSWGTKWGDEGFYYLIRGRNACGIASDVSFPYVN